MRTLEFHNIFLKEMQQFVYFQPGCQIISPKEQGMQIYSLQSLLTTMNHQADLIKTMAQQIDNLKEKVDQMNSKIQILQSQNPKSQQCQLSQSKKRRKYFEKKFCCPYQQCSKVYGSSLALNLHIKQKHNGGTKKQRQAYAKIILNCEEKGMCAPLIQCEFPPGFLQEQRQKFNRH